MSEEEIRHLTISKVQQLQNSINFLNNYITPNDTIDHIGSNKNCEDVYETNLLRELGRINKRRTDIINLLMAINPTK